MGKLFASLIWEQIMSVDKDPSIFSRQMKAIVYMLMALSDIAFMDQLRDITDLLTDLAVHRKSVTRSWRE